MPHLNVRGEADNGAFADGSIEHCGGTIPSKCVYVLWPFGWTANQQKVFQAGAWHGSLLEQKRDGSGLLFKRNRYLDPATGKFTQEDPIGLAGGLNLYGFAAGDPVSFGDPFGLCPNPVASGLGSLQCAIEDIIGAIKSGPAQIADFWTDPQKGGFDLSLATVPFVVGRIEGEGVKLTGRGVVHVLERHFPLGEKSVGKSIFHASESVVDLARGADNVTPVLQPNGNLLRVVNAGREIGIDRATGQGTSVYTVITNKLHELVTMFPGTSP